MQVNSLSKLHEVTAQLPDESVGGEPGDMRDSECMTIAIASLLGLFLAPALAGVHSNENFEGYDDEDSDLDVHSDSRESSRALKTVWDIKTGYAATKVFSKNSCIIAKIDKNFLPGQQFPAQPQGQKGLRPYQLPPRENRFIISTNSLQSLSPYGKRIQALCRGIPSYLAYRAAGSNFLEGDVSCLEVNIYRQPVRYCY
ncbi:gastrokine-1 [Athene cunicularia]|uniref:gastrokine-1 n=1 Tax=Athene cunicularia TaxID=194338 RepID=UPI000EF6F21E|nr:gastrokine-1 [Athene cunicularia]